MSLFDEMSPQARKILDQIDELSAEGRAALDAVPPVVNSDDLRRQRVRDRLDPLDRAYLIAYAHLGVTRTRHSVWSDFVEREKRELIAAAKMLSDRAVRVRGLLK